MNRAAGDSAYPCLVRALAAAQPAVALAAACNLAYARGLVHAQAGNASCRVAGGFLCTPTGCSLGEVGPDDLVEVDAGWRPRQGGRQPTSEWRLHARIYAALSAERAGAVLHTHSPAATLMACLGQDLEELTPEIAHHLGRVPCLPFAAPGSDALGVGVAEAIARGAKAALLGGHGAVVWGSDVRAAFHRAELLEAACALALGLRAAGGAGPRPGPA